jgi:hypothetical protein
VSADDRQTAAGYACPVTRYPGSSMGLGECGRGRTEGRAHCGYLLITRKWTEAGNGYEYRDEDSKLVTTSFMPQERIPGANPVL